MLVFIKLARLKRQTGKDVIILGETIEPITEALFSLSSSSPRSVIFASNCDERAGARLITEVATRVVASSKYFEKWAYLHFRIYFFRGRL